MIIKTNFFTKPKENAGSGSGYDNDIINVQNISSATWANKLKDKHKIYGNDFDGTQDISHHFTVNSPVDTSSFMGFKPAEYKDEHSKLILQRTDLKMEDSTLDMGEESLIAVDKVECNTLYTTVLDSKSSSILVNKPLKLMEGLDLSGQDLKLKNLETENIQNNGSIKTKDLVVTGNAHFFNLVIDEVKHAGGQLILSPGSFRVDAFKTNYETEYCSGTGLVAGEDI